MSKRRYTDQEFTTAVKNSFSMAQTLRAIGLQATGANYKLARLRIKKLGVDNSHWTGQHWMKGKTHNRTVSIPLEKILVENSDYLWNDLLKKRLVKEKILEYKCYECKLTEWRDKPISLQLEHKNGNNTDNRVDNLTLLCPNCHSQTKTFAGRNQKRKREELYCKECERKISYSSKSGLCVKCVKKTIPVNMKYRKVENRPSKEQLLKEIEELGYCGTGRKYGVSDNAIRKWLK
jgi:Zn finger protein HypA/HybF involved in hydrogenase expression